ncbi:MAG: hypothetical protein IPM30_02135 [Burkholderiales bacterium]|nr:hypothetical protein [Burkholderiales bacterium]
MGERGEHRGGARGHRLDVLGGGVQRPLVAAGRTLHDVGHRQDLDVALARLGHPAGGRRAAGDEGTVDVGRQRARLVRRVQPRAAVRSLRNAGRPHVAGRQEHLEVVDVVGVRRAPETHLQHLAVDRVGVDDAHRRDVALLRAEIRHVLDVANTLRVEGEGAGGGFGVKHQVVPDCSVASYVLNLRELNSEDVRAGNVERIELTDPDIATENLGCANNIAAHGGVISRQHKAVEADVESGQADR